MAEGVRYSTGLVRIIALGAGDGGAVANAITLHTLDTGKRAIIRRLRWRNRTGGGGNLLIGFGDRTGAGSLFRQVFPAIFMVNGIDDGLTEGELPVMGNTPEGFFNETTVPTGSNGNILIETDAAAVGAGTPVEVEAEVEVI